MKNFRDLNVWRKAHKVTLDIYKTTEDFPKHQLYSLTSQMQRAALSIEANIAEGCFRSTNKDFKNFLHISGGSASELGCYIEVAKDLNFINKDKYNELHEEITSILKMLSKLISKISLDLKSS